MNQMESASGDSAYATSLAARYGGATCNYYKFIVNLQDNWNTPRKASMNGVLSSMTTLMTSITNYDTTFKQTQANITTYATLLQTNFDSLTNLQTGTLNGIDCRVIYESLNDLRNSVCVGLLSSIYSNFICLILIVYGSLIAGCLTTCAGVRHFKHLQKMQVHVGYKGMPVSITDTTKILEK